MGFLRWIKEIFVGKPAVKAKPKKVVPRKVKPGIVAAKEALKAKERRRYVKAIAKAAPARARREKWERERVEITRRLKEVKPPKAVKRWYQLVLRTKMLDPNGVQLPGIYEGYSKIKPGKDAEARYEEALGWIRAKFFEGNSFFMPDKDTEQIEWRERDLETEAKTMRRAAAVRHYAEDIKVHKMKHMPVKRLKKVVYFGGKKTVTEREAWKPPKKG